MKQNQITVARFELSQSRQATFMEPFKRCPQLDQSTWRDEDRTVAVGKILDIIDWKLYCYFFSVCYFIVILSKEIIKDENFNQLENKIFSSSTFPLEFICCSEVRYFIRSNKKKFIAIKIKMLWLISKIKDLTNILTQEKWKGR